MFLLTEAPKSNNKIFNLTSKDFHNKFSTVKKVEQGERYNSEDKKIYFIRYLFGLSNFRNATIEFASLDKNFKNIHSAYYQDGNFDNAFTMYFKDNTTIEQLLAASKNSNVKSLFKESADSEILSQTLFLSEGRFADWVSQRAPFLMSISSFLPLIAMLLGWAYLIFRRVRMARDQSHAESTAEERLNEFLFKGQNKDEPAFQIYGNITKHLENIISGNSRAMFLYGKPGTSKTYLVRRALHFSGLKPQKDYIIIKGTSADPKKNSSIIYETLWRYNGKIVVFDDFDSALDDSGCIGLLKVALDSYPVRIVSLPNTGYFVDQEIPSKFEYTGKMIVITNKTDIDFAIKSRAVCIEVDYTTKEFESQIKQLLKFLNPHIDISIKEEVFEFIFKELAARKNGVIDFRRFSSIVDLRIAYPEKGQWKNLAREILFPTTY